MPLGLVRNLVCESSRVAPVRRARSSRPQPPKLVIERTRYIKQSDFSGGPVYVDQPNTRVVLTEDVVVDFSRIPRGAESPFHLGFFGAIIVRAGGIDIDLNGHRIDQAEVYRSRQRFFALIEVGVTPLPGNGRVGFTTKEVPLNDISIRNGVLGASSHFGIHSVAGGYRWKIKHIKFDMFETGAISLTAVNDCLITDCDIGHSAAPLTTARISMISDLVQQAEKIGQKQIAIELRSMMAHAKPDAALSDSLVRCIVINPVFNVGLPKLVYGKDRMRRISVRNCTFKDVSSAPEEEIGIQGSNPTDPVRDIVGNLVIHHLASTGSRVTQLQAYLSTGMEPEIRNRLMQGQPGVFIPFAGRDLRGHDLLMKASLFVRIDGCDQVLLSDLDCGKVRSIGNKGAAVGVMMNDCTDCIVSRVRVDGVEITDTCVSALSDTRPQSGMLVRGTTNVDVERFDYASEDFCACTLRGVKNASLSKCAMRAPMTAYDILDVNIDS